MACVLTFALPLASVAPGLAAAAAPTPNRAAARRAPSWLDRKLAPGLPALQPGVRTGLGARLAHYPALARAFELKYEEFAQAGPATATAIEDLLRFAVDAGGDHELLRLAEMQLAFVAATYGERLEPALARRLDESLRGVHETQQAQRERDDEKIAAALQRTAAALGRPSETAGVFAALDGEAGRLDPAEPAAAAPQTEPPSPLKENKAFRRLLYATTLNVFVDNLFKSLLSLALLNMAVDTAVFGHAVTLDSKALIGLVASAMTLPYIPFSGLAGRLAVRVSNTQLLKNSSLLSIPALAGGALLLQMFGLAPATLLPLYAVVAVMGAQGLFFSTAKDSLLLHYVKPAQLAAAVGLFTLTTYAAIIFAFPAGGLLLKYAPLGLAAAAIAGLAVLVRVLLQGLPHVPAVGGATSTIWRTARDTLRQAPDVFRTLLGIGFFSFMGALTITAIPNYGKDLLGLSALSVSLVQALAGIGIGLGARWVSNLSNGRTQLGYVAFGALGMLAAAFWLGLVPAPAAGVVLIGLLGIAAGFFIAPLNSYLLERSGKREAGHKVALGNFIFGVSAFLGSFAFALLGPLGLSPAVSFSLVAAATAVLTGYLLLAFKADALRATAGLLLRPFYRVHVRGIENVPPVGRVLLAANHISFLDAVWLAAVTPRNVRFVMDGVIYSRARFLFEKLKAIPISSRSSEEALRRGVAELGAGRSVGIFSEGELNRIGQQLRPFKARGTETLAREGDAKIVPVHIDGAWGSVFSFAGGRFIFKLPRRLPYHVMIRFGSALPPTASAWRVQQAVMDLGERSARERLERKPPLDVGLVSALKRNWSKLALADEHDGEVALGSGQTLVAGLLLARWLRKNKLKNLPPDTKIGIMLPPLAGGVIANYAALLAQRVSVNVDFIVNNDTPESRAAALARIAALLKQADAGVILTSKTLREKFGIPRDPRMVDIEEVLPRIKARGVLNLAEGLWIKLLPSALLRRLYKLDGWKSSGDTLTMLATTGSTGEPQLVELTHRNMWSMIEGMRGLDSLRPGDVMMSALPLFHAFGLMFVYLAPMFGVPLILHANPREPGRVAALIEKHKATLFALIPSLMPDYMETASPEQMKSLRLTMVGAESMNPAVQEAWTQRYGSAVLPGYGLTEASPIVTASVLDVVDGKVRQHGSKPGSAGRFFPGITARVVDPENPDPNRPLPPGMPGLLWIKGSNVVKGYYKNDEKTAELRRGDWMDTGDIVTVDEEGWVFVIERPVRERSRTR